MWWKPSAQAAVTALNRELKQNPPSPRACVPASCRTANDACMHACMHTCMRLFICGRHICHATPRCITCAREDLKLCTTHQIHVKALVLLDGAEAGFVPPVILADRPRRRQHSGHEHKQKRPLTLRCTRFCTALACHDKRYNVERSIMPPLPERMLPSTLA